MWMFTLKLGISMTRGKKEAVSVLQVVMNGSRDLFHRTAVPPFALLLRRGSSGLCKSSEFREKQYSPWKKFMWCTMSHWKVWGSDKNIRSGECKSAKVLRLNKFFFRLSIFQDNVFRCLGAPVLTGLSELISLNSVNWIQPELLPVLPQ